MDKIPQESGHIANETSSPISFPFSQRSLIPLPYLIFIIIGLIVTIEYSNTLSVPFQFDDSINIADNLKIRHLTAYLNLTSSRYVGSLSLAFNYYLGGVSPFGYHLVNIMIHIANGILIYVMVRLLCQTPFFSSGRSEEPISHWLASATALLFVSHPIQTQAVTYTIQRFTSLSTFFYLLAVIGYLKWRIKLPSDKRRLLWYSTALLATILAMKTKEITFTIPFMLVLVEALFFSTSSRRWVPLVPFLLTLPIIPISRSGALGEGEAGFARQTMDIGRWDYLVTQFRVIVTYLRLLIFPTNQNLDYDYPIYHSILAPPVLLSFLLLSALFISAVCLLFIPARSRFLYVTRFTAFGVLWFFLTLSIESSIIPIQDVIFEHRLYLPSVGFLLAASAPLALVYARWKTQTTLALVGIVTILSVATYQRNGVWKTPNTLWSDVLIKSPNKARAHFGRGTAYDDLGLQDDAAREYHAALRLRPDYAQAHNNLGMIYLKQGRYSDARSEFEEAIRDKPSLATAHNNLGLILAREGQLPKALAEFEKSIQLKDDFAQAYYNRGNVYRDLGDLAKAVQSYQTASRLNPDYAEARSNLGLALYFQGRFKEAAAELQQAVQKNPRYAEAHNNLGVVYRSMGRFNEAIREYRAALAISPRYGQAYRNMGVAFEDLGQLNEAVKAFQAALTINPRDVGVQYEIGNVYSMLGRPRDAIPHYEIAVQLKPAFDEAYYRLGVAYRGIGQVQEARKYLKRALEINPDHQKAREALKSLSRL
jgi:protein O-mannosyl-transferase